MTRALTFREARAEDAPCLGRLAIRSKAHWGYSAEFMRACQAELAVTVQVLEERDRYFEVAVLGAQIAGYYALDGLSNARIELDALFVEPAHIGKGIGRRLIERAKARAKAFGARVLTIQGDPHALAFYRAAGAVEVGTRESGSISGRLLPLLEIELGGELPDGDNGG